METTETTTETARQPRMGEARMPETHVYVGEFPPIPREPWEHPGFRRQIANHFNVPLGCVRLVECPAWEVDTEIARNGGAWHKAGLKILTWSDLVEWIEL